MTAGVVDRVIVPIDVEHSNLLSLDLHQMAAPGSSSAVVATLVNSPMTTFSLPVDAVLISTGQFQYYFLYQFIEKLPSVQRGEL